MTTKGGSGDAVPRTGSRPLTLSRGRRTSVDVVALLGPPGSGKSTVAAALTAERRDLRTFRLREFAQEQARTDRAVAMALANSRDALGWLPDGLATGLARRALEGHVCHGGVLLMESYPGIHLQAACLLDDMKRLGCTGGVIELTAPEPVLLHRIERRLVCSACDPQRRRPAQLDPEKPDTCASCGAALQRRPNDARTVAERRLARYRQCIPRTRASWQSSGLDWRTVDADQDEPLVVTAAFSAFRSLAGVPSTISTKGHA
ncbi:nucleoside monophosphate kinase [Streptomyces phaeochromogenes]|nr:nucleoside monophosphate kinase [Streptomyces phaeochromogenes]